ncbi:hypothetical protein [Bartonella sp. B1099]|uniref:hypothetical protein n=1 Tax=Bartonella sp. B1099 TaxID=2911422 RepID=UPI0020C526BF|nr:hypothetical protein [Bartonella sp. B1099]
MKQENGVIKTINAVMSQFVGQSVEKNVQKVANLIGMEAAIFGLVAYFIYLFTREPLTHHQTPGQRVFTSYARSTWGY